MKLIIGTSNQGKVDFYKNVLAKHFPNLKTLSPHELGVKISVVEDGKTFEENALKKAHAWAKASGLPALATDGGMMIEALGGVPGVLTHRWAGENTTDDEKITFLLKQLDGVPLSKRQVTWREAIAVAKPSGETLLEGAEDRGLILEEPIALENPWAGLWITPVWFVTEFNKPWLHLTQEEHEACDTTYKILNKLRGELENFLC
jgi:XTP/dITP diphosphohydrolase